jgi:hypothetical protein
MLRTTSSADLYLRRDAAREDIAAQLPVAALANTHDATTCARSIAAIYPVAAAAFTSRSMKARTVFRRLLNRQSRPFIALTTHIDLPQGLLPFLASVVTDQEGVATATLKGEIINWPDQDHRVSVSPNSPSNPPVPR